MMHTTNLSNTTMQSITYNTVHHHQNPKA